MEELLYKSILFIVSLATASNMFTGKCKYSRLEKESKRISKDANVVCNDKIYNIVRFSYIEGKFSDSWEKYEKIIGWDNTYTENSRDCDNYSISMVHFCHLISSNNKRGFPVALVHYTTDDGTYHAINAFYTDKGIKFYEPQDKYIVILSDNEKKNIDLFDWKG